MCEKGAVRRLAFTLWNNLLFQIAVVINFRTSFGVLWVVGQEVTDPWGRMGGMKSGGLKEIKRNCVRLYRDCIWFLLLECVLGWVCVAMHLLAISISHTQRLLVINATSHALCRVSICWIAEVIRQVLRCELSPWLYVWVFFWRGEG